MDQQEVDDAFWEQVMQDSRIAILCSQNCHDELVAELEAVGMQDRFDVIACDAMPDGVYTQVDVNSLEAEINEMLQHDWGNGRIYDGLE